MDAMTEFRGWLLDLYPDENGLTLWFIREDGERIQLHQPFPISFYASGVNAELRALWKWLDSQPEEIELSRVERRDLFSGFIPVLQAQIVHPVEAASIFARAAQTFPALTYYDADIPISLRYAARYNVYPLAYCEIRVHKVNTIEEIRPLTSPWELNTPLPPIKVMHLEPDKDPFYGMPTRLKLRTKRRSYEIDLEPVRPLLIALRSELESFDPDLILTNWGDTWLLPYLFEASKKAGIPLPFNRDLHKESRHKTARTYYAYGQVIYRGAQVHLAGRWHVDAVNAVMYHDYGLEGIWELARLTALPVQTVARVSPGTGISAMQMNTALQENILVPWHKQQVEARKSIFDLIRTDMGGLVYQPTIGTHKDVAEIDFISMYPSIMVHFNISPETIRPGLRDDTGLPLTSNEKGLIPKTLEPLLQKRIALKRALLTLSKWDMRYKPYKARSAAHKWLLVTCFGYLGYKNARFGRIEAHEAVTAYGREALLLAKEAAEDLGYTVLHMYVDGLWVHKQGADQAEHLMPLLDAIIQRTGLPITLDGIYRWVRFLPSRMNKRVPVANRYFGVFQSGEIKTRGIALRRHDTPKFISQTQLEVLEILAKDTEPALAFPKARTYIQQQTRRLLQGQVPLADLLVSQTLSRDVEAYRVPSPVARAARQLMEQGRHIQPGMRLRFHYTRGRQKVRAWEEGEQGVPVDIKEYRRLLERAVDEVVDPLEPQRLF